MAQQTTDIQQEIQKLNEQFLQSSDFTAKEISLGPGEQAILCFYSSLVKKNEVEQSLYFLKSERKKAVNSESDDKQKNKQPETNSKSSNAEQNMQPESNSQSSNTEQNMQPESNSQSSNAEQNMQPESNSQPSNAEQNMQPESNSQPNNAEQNMQPESNSQPNNTEQNKQPESNSQSNNAEQNMPAAQTLQMEDDTAIITTEPYDNQKLIEYICNGETLVILLQTKEMIRLDSPDFVHRTPDEPENEHILRGSHEGFVENFDSNVSLIRKRIKNNKLIVKKLLLGKETKTVAYYFYLDDAVDKEALKIVEERLQAFEIDKFYSIGQLSDNLDDQVWSPFPQLLNTERPDRVVANIVEGKIAIMTDFSPTALIGPVTFFSFYQSPDDFNSRVLVGSFYRIMRIFSFLAAIFLPAFYIAVVSFHFEVLPLELANKVKQDINQIPYRPLIEAMIMEITIELIREASVRLPKSIGQTIGIVGGLVIGQSIVSAGLVSNLMIIVVALTAISSFVVPSVELNTTIRLIRFPFMFLASLFGFFGILIGTFLLVVHLLNLSSLKKPYFSPIIPFQPKELYKIFFREPHFRAKKQVTSFSPPKDDKT